MRLAPDESLAYVVMIVGGLTLLVMVPIILPIAAFKLIRHSLYK